LQVVSCLRCEVLIELRGLPLPLRIVYDGKENKPVNVNECASDSADYVDEFLNRDELLSI
jgi:hypothetical protein